MEDNHRHFCHFLLDCVHKWPAKRYSSLYSQITQVPIWITWILCHAYCHVHCHLYQHSLRSSTWLYVVLRNRRRGWNSVICICKWLGWWDRLWGEVVLDCWFRIFVQHDIVGSDATNWFTLGCVVRQMQQVQRQKLHQQLIPHLITLCPRIY